MANEMFGNSLSTSASFCLFFFPNTNFTEKTVGFSGIQTRIVKVEGEHADHLTTATARATEMLNHQK